MSVVKDKNVNTTNEEPAWSTYTSPKKMEGVMEYVAADSIVKYNVYRTRWLMLGLFVLYSSSNSMQWMQYTIIQDVIVKYYNVPSTLVSWTSMIYMITYVPLIFPGSWLLDKTVGYCFAIKTKTVNCLLEYLYKFTVFNVSQAEYCLK